MSIASTQHETGVERWLHQKFKMHPSHSRMKPCSWLHFEKFEIERKLKHKIVALRADYRKLDFRAQSNKLLHTPLQACTFTEFVNSGIAMPGRSEDQREDRCQEPWASS